MRSALWEAYVDAKDFERRMAQVLAGRRVIPAATVQSIVKLLPKLEQNSMNRYNAWLTEVAKEGQALFPGGTGK